MTETRQALLPGWMRAILFLPAFLIAYFLGTFTFAFVLSMFHGPQAGDFMNQIREDNLAWFVLYNIFVFVFVLGCVWLFQNLLTQKPMKDAGFGKQFVGKHFTMGVLAGLAVNAAIFIALWSAGYLVIHNINFRFDLLFFSVIITLLVSLIEELSMRGYLLASLMDSMNKYLALAVSSMVFAIFHLFNPNMNLIGFSNIFLAGCLMGIGYIYNRSLWFPIALHFSWNFFLGPVFGFEVSGLSYRGILQHNVSGPEWLTGGAFGAEGSLLLTILLLLLIFALRKVFREEVKS